jgi:hypothetical protein
MPMSWDDLDAELAAWADAGIAATMWVRDDDAQSRSQALDRLIDLCAGNRIPLALAVIPKGADETLASAVAAERDVHVLQHGWCHANHAGPNDKKTELGDHRPAAIVGAELDDGWRRLLPLFGDRLLPVVAPPWNRIGTEVALRLGGWGYRGLSTMGPRRRTVAAPGLVRVNTHIDIIDWKGTRGYRGDANVLEQAIAHLKARRLGEADADEPTGLITHHLDHDEGCWGLIEKFLDCYSDHAAVRWPTIPAVFGLA